MARSLITERSTVSANTILSWLESPGVRLSRIQPKGPFFKTQGNILTWKKWRVHVGFNYQKGIVLHNISLFYRLFVPYGDPWTPYNRKAAFDLGNNGAGVCTNNLKLGYDCLGHKIFRWLA